jgi:hypothetical protein
MDKREQKRLRKEGRVEAPREQTPGVDPDIAHIVPGPQPPPDPFLD